MFQNVLMDPKILKEKLLIFFNLFWNICVLSILFLIFVFPISYKCECVIPFEYVEIIS